MCEGWCGGVTSRHLETEAPTIRASQSAAYMVHLLYWLCSASIRAPCSVVQLVSLGGYRCKPLVCTPLCRTNSLTAALLCRLSHQGSSLAAVTPHLPLACPLFCLRTHPVALHLSSFSCLLSVCDFSVSASAQVCWFLRIAPPGTAAMSSHGTSDAPLEELPPTRRPGTPMQELIGIVNRNAGQGLSTEGDFTPQPTALLQLFGRPTHRPGGPALVRPGRPWPHTLHMPPATGRS